ncbi:MAG: alpha/beta fold hydrolase [Alphaproteobacteria bacterium]
MQKFQNRGTKIAYETRGAKLAPLIIWAHGWGQTHTAFSAIAESLNQSGRHLLIDLPGFGVSPVPSEPWGTADYADALAALIREQDAGKVIWVGHSFGCRVGLQMAARHPDLAAGLFLIAAAGLPRKRYLIQKIYLETRIYTFKILKSFIPHGPVRDRLLKKFMKGDYASAGPMRAIFVKTVNEDLTPLLSRIRCPVKLVYGADDSETPPEIGRRIQKGIAGAEMVTLEGQDHYTMLGEGRHPVVSQLKKFIEDLS